MACAAASGVIVVLLKHTVVNAVKTIAMGSLLHLHRLVQALPALLQATLHHLLASTTMLITEKIVASLHTLGTGKLVLPMRKLMHIHTL
jgi:hypothetical protein